MNRLIWDVVLWIFASPIYVMQWLWRAALRWRFLLLAYTPRIICRNCHLPVSLVGFWRCRCGFTYSGHLLRVCPVCRTRPRMARCYACGATERLPEP